MQAIQSQAPTNQSLPGYVPQDIQTIGAQNPLGFVTTEHQMAGLQGTPPPELLNIPQPLSPDEIHHPPQFTPGTEAFTPDPLAPTEVGPGPGRFGPGGYDPDGRSVQERYRPGFPIDSRMDWAFMRYMNGQPISQMDYEQLVEAGLVPQPIDAPETSGFGSGYDWGWGGYRGKKKLYVDL